VAVLRQANTGARVSLGPNTMVGRSPRCDLTLDDPRVSSLHAQLTYTPQRGWTVQDLSSSNGTRLDDVALHRRTKLGRAGQRIEFGHDAQTWIVETLGPPVPVACRASDDHLREAEHGVLTLPSDDSPQVVVLEDDSGAWVTQDGRPLASGEVLHVDGERWTVLLPPPTPDVGASTEPVSDEDVHVRVVVTAPPGEDQVLVEATVRVATQVVHLEHCSPMRMLALLAEARAESDRLAQHAEAERGWVNVEEELLPQLGLTNPQQFYVYTNRLRRLFAECGVPRASDMVEARGRGLSRRMRLRRVPLEFVLR